MFCWLLHVANTENMRKLHMQQTSRVFFSIFIMKCLRKSLNSCSFPKQWFSLFRLLHATQIFSRTQDSCSPNAHRYDLNLVWVFACVHKDTSHVLFVLESLIWNRHICILFHCTFPLLPYLPYSCAHLVWGCSSAYALGWFVFVAVGKRFFI